MIIHKSVHIITHAIKAHAWICQYCLRTLKTFSGFNIVTKIIRINTTHQSYIPKCSCLGTFIMIAAIYKIHAIDFTGILRCLWRCKHDKRIISAAGIPHNWTVYYFPRYTLCLIKWHFPCPRTCKIIEIIIRIIHIKLTAHKSFKPDIFSFIVNNPWWSCYTVTFIKYCIHKLHNYIIVSLFQPYCKLFCFILYSISTRQSIKLILSFFYLIRIIYKIWCIITINILH